MRGDRHWVDRTRRHAKRECLTFSNQLTAHALLATHDPARFIRFVIRHYPKYLAGLGVYNYYWRYLEFADTTLVPFPQRGLRQLGIERNALANIYPRCEQLLRQATHRLAPSFHINPFQMLMMGRAELSTLLATRHLPVSQTDLKKRSRGYLYLFTDRHEHINTRHNDLLRIRQYIKTVNQSGYYQRQLQGTAVQPGRVAGIVVHKLGRKSWPKNPVYIVSNTHPAEVPYLKKVSAIVTDEGGGILSHAAIVSRELGIPCVIGTKVATKIFKDGDRVEVDANKGIIRKLTSK